MILFASFVIAAALNPYVNKIEEKIKNRAAATISVLTLSGIVLTAVLLPVILACYKEIELFAVTIPQKITTLYHLITHTKIYGKTPKKRNIKILYPSLLSTIEHEVRALFV